MRVMTRMGTGIWEALGDDGAFKGMTSGAIFVDHTTVSAQVTAELYAAADAAQTAALGKGSAAQAEADRAQAAATAAAVSAGEAEAAAAVAAGMVPIAQSPNPPKSTIDRISPLAARCETDQTTTESSCGWRRNRFTLVGAALATKRKNASAMFSTNTARTNRLR